MALIRFPELGLRVSIKDFSFERSNDFSHLSTGHLKVQFQAELHLAWVERADRLAGCGKCRVGLSDIDTVEQVENIRADVQ
jgi:hypothetical protein